MCNYEYFILYDIHNGSLKIIIVVVIFINFSINKMLNSKTNLFQNENVLCKLKVFWFFFFFPLNFFAYLVQQSVFQWMKND